MMESLPPDPYKALGLAKDADLSAIKSAYRKLALTCHPDKTQRLPEAEQKAKADQFQKAQQAYETLGDEQKKEAYDLKVRLDELRKERARSNVFEFQVKHAEPRSTTYPTRHSVYTSTPPRSYEDFSNSDSRGVPRKSSSYESERKRASVREEERDRGRYEDERLRQKVERKAEKIAEKMGYVDKKKSRDKERRRGVEEKSRVKVSSANIEETSSEDEAPRSRYEKRSSKRRSEEEMRKREEMARQEGIREERERAAREREYERERQKERERASIKAVDLDPKWQKHGHSAAQYIRAARERGSSEPHMDHPPMMRRAQTFAAPAPSESQRYNVSYSRPTVHAISSDDEDMPRRSSGRRETRRSSEAPISRQDSLNREKSSKSSRRSPPHPDLYIVEPPSPPPPTRKPGLYSQSSAPPNLPSSTSRKEPVRSRTTDYPRVERSPPVRAATFAAPSDRQRKSGLRHEHISSDTDSDIPTESPRRSYSPPPRSRPEPTRYIINDGRAVPSPRSTDHRADLQDSFHRERSESPGSRRDRDRPSMSTRSSTERPRAPPTRSQSTAYYPPSSSRNEPIIVDAMPSRPKLARENSRSNVHSSPRSSSTSGAYFPEGGVKYAPQYGHENVAYSSYPPSEHAGHGRRGSDGMTGYGGGYGGGGGGGREYVSHVQHGAGGYGSGRGNRQGVYI